MADSIIRKAVAPPKILTTSVVYEEVITKEVAVPFTIEAIDKEIISLQQRIDTLNEKKAKAMALAIKK